MRTKGGILAIILIREKAMDFAVDSYWNVVRLVRIGASDGDLVIFEVYLAKRGPSVK